MSFLESKFIPLREACQIVTGVETFYPYPPIYFLQDPCNYLDLVTDLHVSGSITTPNPLTMGESPLSSTVQALHNRKVRLPARVRRKAQDMSSYLDTNIHSCVNAGMFDLSSLSQDGKAWYKTLKAISGSNFDLVAKSIGPVMPTYELLFNRFASMLEEMHYSSAFLSLIHNGRSTYLHFRDVHYPHSQHFNLFLFENTYLDSWNDMRTSRSSQVRELVVNDNQPGYYTDPAFYTRPGELVNTPATFGTYLAETAKEIRLAATNPPHQLSISSFREKRPNNLLTSFSEESLWLGNLTLAAIHRPDLVFDLLELLDLTPILKVDDKSLADVRSSLNKGEIEYFKYPKRSIYPNSPLHTLTDIAPYIQKFLTMPLKQFIGLAANDKGQHKVTKTRFFKPD